MTLLDAAAETTETTAPIDEDWVDVCAIDDLIPDRGVCALVAGAPVAVFRCWPDDELRAIGNMDPFSGASVLSRGIVGSMGDRLVVASPVYKNRFDLRSGESLDDASIVLPTHAVRVVDGRVQLARSQESAISPPGNGRETKS